MSRKNPYDHRPSVPVPFGCSKHVVKAWDAGRYYILLHATKGYRSMAK